MWVYCGITIIGIYFTPNRTAKGKQAREQLLNYYDGNHSWWKALEAVMRSNKKTNKVMDRSHTQRFFL